MKLSMNTSQRQRIHLLLTPKMEQALYLLQAPVPDLAEYMQRKANENPFLQIEVPASTYAIPIRAAKVCDTASLVQDRTSGIYAVLEEQLSLADGSESLRTLALYFAGNLDASGYLRIGLVETAEALHCSLEEAEQALELLQSCDPAGIGARDLRECLMLQISRDASAVPYAADIVDRFLFELAEGRTHTIHRTLDITKDELETAIDYIRGLDPKPAAFYSEPELSAVIPEIEVILEQDRLEIRLLDEYLPSVTLNEDFVDVIGTGRDANPLLEQQWFEAQALIANFERRKQTFRQVVFIAVNAQKQVFKEGLSKMKPLLLKDVAVELGLHESTVSRAVQGKYIHTNFGVIAARELFSKPIRTAESSGVSVSFVKHRIGALVREEDRREPLSDERIATRLEAEGIRLSRRTVAQYRKSLHIPNSSQRRRK